MKILILDDDKGRHTLFNRNFIGHTITNVETAADAISALRITLYDAVFLDHDLGGHTFVESNGPEETGYTVAKWMVENPDRKPKIIYIHSFNPTGAANIQSILPGSILAPGLWNVQQ
jgi:CheY-like chemotaxis protein